MIILLQVWRSVPDDFCQRNIQVRNAFLEVHILQMSKGTSKTYNTVVFMQNCVSVCVCVCACMCGVLTLSEARSSNRIPLTIKHAHHVKRGGFQNIPDWCRHPYSSCGSAKYRFQQAKMWTSGSTAMFWGQLRENVWRCRPEIWREQTWLLHHDNAPSHTSVLTQPFLAKQ
jgi:hypothetical protein